MLNQFKERVLKFINSIVVVVEQAVEMLRVNVSDPKRFLVAVLFLGIAVDLLLSIFGIDLGLISKLVVYVQQIGTVATKILADGGVVLAIIVIVMLLKDKKA